MEEEGGYYNLREQRANYEEVRQFQTRDEFEQWWENQRLNWTIHSPYADESLEHRYYFCRHRGPNNGRCPARLRVVIHGVPGQLHVVSETPDRPHQHANPQDEGRVDNLRTPRIEYQEIRRSDLGEHMLWWMGGEYDSWRFDSRRINDGWEQVFYQCRDHDERQCPARLRIAFSPGEELIIVATSSVPHNH